MELDASVKSNKRFDEIHHVGKERLSFTHQLAPEIVPRIMVDTSNGRYLEQATTHQHAALGRTGC